MLLILPDTFGREGTDMTLVNTKKAVLYFLNAMFTLVMLWLFARYGVIVKLLATASIFLIVQIVSRGLNKKR